MAEKTDREECSTCQYNRKEECRLKPPVPLVQLNHFGDGHVVESHWPWVPADGWCGEYKNKNI